MKKKKVTNIIGWIALAIWACVFLALIAFIGELINRM